MSMQVFETSIPGAYLIVPQRHEDRRGAFMESFRTSVLDGYLSTPFTVRQVNYSISCRGTLRGVHGVTVPPGQAKFVSCVRGAMQDVIVDLRVGSPTFGRYATHDLDPHSGRAVYIPDGVGHAFLATEDDTCACYAVSTEFVPGSQIEVDALDPAIGIDWRLDGDPLMSDKDRAAPGLAEAAASGLLGDHPAPRQVPAGVAR